MQLSLDTLLWTGIMQEHVVAAVMLRDQESLGRARTLWDDVLPAWAAVRSGEGMARLWQRGCMYADGNARQSSVGCLN
jgi:hypothetical protein